MSENIFPRSDYSIYIYIPRASLLKIFSSLDYTYFANDIDGAESTRDCTLQHNLSAIEYVCRCCGLDCQLERSWDRGYDDSAVGKIPFI